MYIYIYIYIYMYIYTHKHTHTHTTNTHTHKQVLDEESSVRDALASIIAPIVRKLADRTNV